MLSENKELTKTVGHILATGWMIICGMVFAFAITNHVWATRLYIGVCWLGMVIIAFAAFKFMASIYTINFPLTKKELKEYTDSAKSNKVSWYWLPPILTTIILFGIGWYLTATIKTIMFLSSLSIGFISKKILETNELKTEKRFENKDGCPIKNATFTEIEEKLKKSDLKYADMNWSVDDEVKSLDDDVENTNDLSDRDIALLNQYKKLKMISLNLIKNKQKNPAVFKLLTQIEEELRDHPTLRRFL